MTQDGVFAVPPALLERADQTHQREEFSRNRLAAGGDLRSDHPLPVAALPEDEARRARNPR